MQASSVNIRNIIKIKEFFLNLSLKKIKDIHKVINDIRKKKPKFKMTTKGLSRRQVLVFISPENSKKFMILSGQHIANINKALENIKSNVLADYIRADNRSLAIVTNKVTLESDLTTIEKNTNVIESREVTTPRLPQSKSYLKILGIPYLIEETNISITADIIEKVIQSTHIFNDVVLASKLRIIKAFSKLDLCHIPNFTNLLGLYMEFSLSKSELLYSVLLMKHLLGDLF